MSQRDALMFVYESTSGKRWTKRMHWSTEYHLSSWEGVKIDACGHVQSLVLNSNGLSGEIKFSDRLKPLQHVENLSLSSNALFGDINAIFVSMTSLKEINLSWNLFCGQFPQELLNLGKTLRMLRLDNNKFSGAIPDQISSLNELRYLNLSNNNFEGRIPFAGLARLRNLYFIDLKGNQLDGIIPVCLRDIESQLTDEEALVLEMEGQQSEDSSYCSSGSQLEM